jgi:hypothetical protein
MMGLGGRLLPAGMANLALPVSLHSAALQTHVGFLPLIFRS